MTKPNVFKAISNFVAKKVSETELESGKKIAVYTYPEINCLRFELDGAAVYWDDIKWDMDVEDYDQLKAVGVIIKAVINALDDLRVPDYSNKLEELLNKDLDEHDILFHVSETEPRMNSICYKIRKDSWLNQEANLWCIDGDWKLVMDGTFAFQLTKDSKLTNSELEALQKGVLEFVKEVQDDDE